MDTKGTWNHWPLYRIVILACVLFIILWCCTGCEYASIHKRDIHEHLTLFRAFRNFTEVKAAFDAELVNKGADDMEKTLEAWRGKGDWDAGNE